MGYVSAVNELISSVIEKEHLQAAAVANFFGGLVLLKACVSSPWPFGCSMLHLFWRKPGEMDQTLHQFTESNRLYRKLTGGHVNGMDSIIWAEAMLMRGKDEEAEILCYKALYDAKSFQQVGVYLCAKQLLARIAILRGDTEGYWIAIKNIRIHVQNQTKLHLIRTAELTLAKINILLGSTAHIPEWLCSAEGIEKALYSYAVHGARVFFFKKLLVENRLPELYGYAIHLMENHNSMMMLKLYNLIFLAVAKQREAKIQEARTHLEEALEDRKDRSRVIELLTLCKRYEQGRLAIKKVAPAFQSPLTSREREIAILDKERLSSKEIANRLYLAETTIRTVLRNIQQALDSFQGRTKKQNLLKDIPSLLP